MTEPSAKDCLRCGAPAERRRRFNFDDEFGQTGLACRDCGHQHRTEREGDGHEQD